MTVCETGKPRNSQRKATSAAHRLSQRGYTDFQFETVAADLSASAGARDDHAAMGAGAGSLSGEIDGATAMGAMIRTLRGRARLSQIALGARIAMHHNYLGTIERGGVPNPGLETVDRIARGLGVSIAVLAASYARPSATALTDAGSGVRRGHDAVAVDGARSLGEAIRIVRGLRRLTQAKLADAAELHRSHLASVEAGEKPSPGIGTIASIARGLESGHAEPPLLALLAQTFTGELPVADLRARLAARPSGPGARPVPHQGATP